MKKILIISGIFPPDIGGPATFVKDLFSYIKEKKDNVKVITLQDKDKIKYREDNIIKIDRGKNKILRTLEIIYKIRKNSRDIDTILCCGLIFETYLSQIGLSNKKIYRFVSDSIWDKYQSKRYRSKFKIQKNSFFINLLIIFRNKILKSFDLVITPSNFLKKFYLKNIDKGNIKIISNFTNLKIDNFSKSIDFTDFKNKNKINYITLSRLVKHKNINYLIEAFKDLPDCNLYIYGSGPEEDFYKNLLNKNKADNIFMLGKKNRNEIIESLLKSDCFIQISSYEGMSFSVLEALSLHKPMILSNIEPNIETAKEAAIYVNPYSISQLKNTINLLRCNEIRKKMAHKSKKIYSQFYDREKSLCSYYNEL